MDGTMWNKPDLHGRVALVAGATRGAGRAIALALAGSGALVWCTGRSVAGAPGIEGRPETIHETARLIAERGGEAVARRVDHSRPAEVRALMDEIDAEHGRLDILINDIWGGNRLTQWGKTLWEHPLDDGLTLLERGLHTHIITAHHAAPLVVAAKGIVVEVTDGTDEDNKRYRGNMFYDLVKTGVNRFAFALDAELAPHGAAAVAVTPGFLRSEEMLDHFGVSEENWRDAVASDPFFAHSETPHFVARGIAHLVADPERRAFGGTALSSIALARRYGVRDVDGSQPDMQAALRAAGF